VTVSVEWDVWDNIVLITVFEELSEKYDSQKNHFIESERNNNDRCSINLIFWRSMN